MDTPEQVHPLDPAAVPPLPLDERPGPIPYQRPYEGPHQGPYEGRGEPGASAFGQWAPEPGPTAATPGGPPSATGLRRRSMVAACLGAAVIGLGGFFAIQAASAHAKVTTGATASTSRPGFGGQGGAGGPDFGGPGGGPGGVTAGTLSAVNGSTLSVTTRSGAIVKVVTSGTTVVTQRVTGTVSDIQSGHHVLVLGTTSGAAQQITDLGTATAVQGPAGGPRGDDSASGTVAGISGSTLTLTKDDGSTLSMTTSPSTRVDLVRSIPVSSLATGETVRVMGTTASDGTVTAAVIDEGTAGGFGPGGPGFGSGAPGGPPA